MSTGVIAKIVCYHCGDECIDNSIHLDEKVFCCQGCKLVFEVLQENNLCSYYTLNDNPGNKRLTETDSSRFAYLDNRKIQEFLISFSDKEIKHVTFHIPSIHCSSCIYLLENFHRINNGVVTSRIDFIRKTLNLHFDSTVTSLRQIVEQLSRIGYEPSIHLDALEKKQKTPSDRSRIYKIGVAGFCFGNIMMLSLPDYLATGYVAEKGLQTFFNYLNLMLSLPVFFFSATEFFNNAWNGLKEKATNIDLPISIGIVAMFARSVYEVISGTGTGYFDSMSGLVFFMLIGRKFQAFTFDSLAFDRDFKSYFPVSVNRVKEGSEHAVPVYDVEVNDRIMIRSNELIPVDGILLKGNASIDYSFVTGESNPVAVNAGETVFAGGRQTNGMIDVLVTKKLAQSYLTQLWNQQKGRLRNNFEKLVLAISKWFIVITLLIALSAGLYWYGTDPSRALNAFTSVLVIACACALALSAPFTFGNIIRIVGRNKIFLRGNETIESLAGIDTIVFDKTGTLTCSNSKNINYYGEALSEEEKKIAASLFNQSAHPLSRRICTYLQVKNYFTVNDFSDTPGAGLAGSINGMRVKAGNASFVGAVDSFNAGSCVYISVNNRIKGFFQSSDQYRDGVDELIRQLQQQQYKLVLLSGDNNAEEKKLRLLFGQDAELHFNQRPEDKLAFIRSLQEKGHKVLMVGDGLNDAGAFLQSDEGLSVSEDVNNFTPASSGIMDASRLVALPYLLRLCRTSIRIIIWSFIISLLYNVVGLAFAVQGLLSPVIAAILMPVSTISLVLFTVTASTLAARLNYFRKADKNHNHP